jgi:hypothetical protein
MIVMTQYINKDALVAEIEDERKFYLDKEEYDFGWNNALDKILSLLDTIEVKEVDLEKEITRVSKNEYFDFTDWRSIARHFFELGLQVNNPITAADRGIAEEIIISLKQVENDYHIDQTKEIEWIRNKVKKGE